MSEKLNDAPLLRVENLCQYFKLGKNELKAVDNVSFDINKGEVFGLVGESGCGKTTTGRTIIGLYQATGGSVYYEGKRIVAGTRTFKDAINKAKKDFKENKISNEEFEKICNENLEEIKKAKHDTKYRDKDFKQFEVDKLNVTALPKKEQLTKEYIEKKEQLALDPQNEEKKREFVTISKKYTEFKSDYKRALKLANKDRIMNKIQMIFQDPIASLDPRMTVRDIIAEGLIIRGFKDKEHIDEQVYKVLDLVGLVKEHATRYPHEFSGGQRQRIGIARAIVLNPNLIIADEPVSALDVSIQAQVINLLNELRKSMGLTVLFIAHDLSVVKYFSDRIGVMYFGKMVELAPSDELFKNPLHPYTKSLLSAIPLPDPRYEKKRQRITYVPLRDHDYSKQGPTMREITPGHFILCNDEEFEKYKNNLKK